MSIFARIGNTAAARGKGIFLTAGTYTVAIVSCRHVKSKVGTDEFFVADLDVQESSNAGVQPGSPATWMCKLTGRYPDMALADVKAFIVAATSAAESDVDESVVMEAIEGDGTELAGSTLRIRVEDIKTKAGASFSKHNFYALS